MSRPKLNKVLTSPYSVQPDTIGKLEKLGLSLGFKYGKGVAMGRFLDTIANLDPDLLASIIAKSEILNKDQQL
jgi:hypothetical protein